MWITKEMAKDFEEGLVWNPRPTNFIQTLEDVSDALSAMGYSIEIKKRN